MKRYCYANSIENFLNEEKSNWLNKMKKNFRENYNLELGELQIKAWDDSFEQLKKILVKIEEINNIKIRFSYEMYNLENVLKAKAETVNVFVDENGKLKRISNELLKKITK